MSCTGTRYATAEQYSKMFCGEWPLEADMQARVETALDMSAMKIDLVLQSIGACDCTLSDAGSNGLAYLNCLLAVVHYRCPCNSVDVTDDLRRLYAEEAQNMIEALTDGRWEVCDGETGSQVLAIDWAEQATTPWNTARIIINTARRNS